MKRLVSMALMCMTLQFLVSIPLCSAEQKIQKQGPYLVAEGKVTQIITRSLVIDGQQYPISMFARVFEASLSGREIPLHLVVNIGKIDLARIYILGGKVEKIVVLYNI
ncbi:MAG: hypothetical protein IPQ16_08330 [Geobacteraceae bacterium]|nr:hypothetical protein [Geobacteraceae bacterium]